MAYSFLVLVDIKKLKKHLFLWKKYEQKKEPHTVGEALDALNV